MSGSFRILVYPWLWLISKLPFPILYGFSSFIAFLLYRVVGYRKAIVRTNLANSFPEKSIAELMSIEKKFYSHLADLMVETIKGMTMTEAEIRERVILQNVDELERLKNNRQSCVVVMSHCGNWEWVCIGAQMITPLHAQCVYKKLKNKNWDNWFFKLRSRFGTEPFPMEKTLRVMIQHAHTPCATALIGDQNPSNTNNVHWTRFLNQDTCFMNGSEKISKKLDQAVYYMTVEKRKRGHYECKVSLLCAEPNATKDGEITEMIARATEAEISKQPENWLWSHRRWKHKRPKNLQGGLAMKPSS